MSAIRPVTSKTLLDYQLTPHPDPPQASATSGDSAKSLLALTFVASVPAKSPGAYCTKLQIDLPVGAAPPAACDNASDLTCKDTFDVDKDTSGNWTLESNSGGTVVFSRSATAEIVKQGYTFTLRNIEVSPVVGTVEITVSELSSPDGKTFMWRKATFDLAKFPHATRPVRFDADATAVEPGDQTNLTWLTSPGIVYDLTANGVTVDGFTGKPPWPTGPLTESTQFTLTTGYGKTVQRTYHVEVLVLTAVVNLMGPSEPVRQDDPVTLTWHTENVKNCTVGVKGSARPTSVDKLPNLVVHPHNTPTTEYVLSSETAAGGPGQQSHFIVTVLPKAPPKPRTQLVLIQTDGNGDGKIAIHVDDGERGFQQRLHDLATGWAETDGPNGTWAIANFQFSGNTPDLALIKTSGLPAARGVELHTCYAPQHGQGDEDNQMLAFAAWQAPAGRWLLAPMGDEITTTPSAVVVFVQTTAMTGSAVQVYHTLFLHPGNQPIGPWVTPFAAADAERGTWLLANMDGDGLPPDLVFVQTAGTQSKHVELSYATGASHYAQLGKNNSGKPEPCLTKFGTGHAADGSWHLADMTGDGKPDLVFVRTANTPSKRVEIHWADAASGYQNLSGGFTEFDIALGPKGTWQVIGADSPFRF